MQTARIKYLTFLTLLGYLSSLTALVTAQPRLLQAADSLFATGRFDEARGLYLKQYGVSEKNNPNLLLKLAFLAEKANDPARSLYFLSVLAQKHPSAALLEKMSSMATAHELSGYKFDDMSYFLIFYRRYGGYVPILLLTLGIYVVLVMLIKIRNGEKVQRRHKWAAIAYLTALLGLLNIPASYQTGVLKSRLTYAREFPTAAAPVVEMLRKGHKITVIGSRDRWKRVVWQGKIVFIRDTDIWIL